MFVATNLGRDDGPRKIEYRVVERTPDRLVVELDHSKEIRILKSLFLMIVLIGVGFSFLFPLGMWFSTPSRTFPTVVTRGVSIGLGAFWGIASLLFLLFNAIPIVQSFFLDKVNGRASVVSIRPFFPKAEKRSLIVVDSVEKTIVSKVYTKGNYWVELFLVLENGSQGRLQTSSFFDAINEPDVLVRPYLQKNR